MLKGFSALRLQRIIPAGGPAQLRIGSRAAIAQRDDRLQSSVVRRS